MSKGKHVSEGVQEPIVTLALNKILRDEADNISGNRHSKRDVELLAESIRQFRDTAPNTAGLMNPLVVMPIAQVDGEEILHTHKLVSGNKRHQALGLVYADEPDIEIPVVVADVAGIPAQFLNLDENVTQTGLTSWDLSCAAQKLVDAGVSRQDVAKRIGKTLPYVSYILSFQKLRGDVQKKIHDGTIPFRLARVLASLEESEQDARIQAVEEGAGASETADAAVTKRGKKKGGRKGKHETETGDGGEKKGLSAKKAVLMLTEQVGKIKEQEKLTKADEALVSVLTVTGKLLQGKMGIAAYVKKVAELV